MSEHAARVAAHVKNLLENGAPHQQEIARDMQAVLKDSQDAVTDAHQHLKDLQAKFNTMRDNVARLVDEKHELGKQVATLKEQLGAMKPAVSQPAAEMQPATSSSLGEGNKYSAQQQQPTQPPRQVDDPSKA